MTGTRSLTWVEFREIFEADVTGRLPDCCVPETTMVDWCTVADLVTERWVHSYAKGGLVAERPQAGDVSADERWALKVWVTTEIIVIFRFFGPDTIDFDFDLLDVQNSDTFAVFSAFLAEVGHVLEKPIILGNEGYSRPLARYDPVTKTLSGVNGDDTA